MAGKELNIRGDRKHTCIRLWQIVTQSLFLYSQRTLLCGVSVPVKQKQSSSNMTQTDQTKKHVCPLTGTQSRVFCGLGLPLMMVVMWTYSSKLELCCSSSVERLRCQPRHCMGGTIVKWATAAGNWSTPSAPEHEGGGGEERSPLQAAIKLDMSRQL